MFIKAKAGRDHTFPFVAPSPHIDDYGAISQKDTNDVTVGISFILFHFWIAGRTIHSKQEVELMLSDFSIL